ncbi:MAG: RNA polymerase sigma-70 factor [Nocardioidaceae bacterium]|nr:RNA polymerase sigma-70 factor [Nocardioidaceae bacterium]
MTAEALDDALGHFDAARPRLFGIAYRMLGSVAEAEDVVQDAWLRWQQADRAEVRNPAAFLTTVVTRLSLNVAESARVRREEYVGPWLPEPVDTSADPSLGAENAEALEYAVLMLLERLGPEQRAAYVLREAFGYAYEDIAEILATSAANARQLVSRARRYVRSGRRAPVDRDRHRDLVEAFLAAARDGDVARLEVVLAADVVSISDGAGVAPRAARRPVSGANDVARFVAGFTEWWAEAGLTWVEVNGRPAVVVHRDGQPLAVLSATTSDAGIEQLLWVMAPAKLTRV